jgi:hypothetical protein
LENARSVFSNSALSWHEMENSNHSIVSQGVLQ